MDRNERRRGTRVRMVMQARMSSAGLPDVDILIRNFSVQGLGARCRQRTPVAGEKVGIHIEQLPELQGTVRWVDGELFGVALDQELDLSIFDLPDPVSAPAPRPGFDF